MLTERGLPRGISNRVLRIGHTRCELGRIGGSWHEKGRRIFAPRFRVSNTGANGPSSTPRAIGRDGTDVGAACRSSQGQDYETTQGRAWELKSITFDLDLTGAFPRPPQAPPFVASVEPLLCISVSPPRRLLPLQRDRQLLPFRDRYLVFPLPR